MAKPSLPAEIYQVRISPTPLAADLLFYELRDGDYTRNNQWQYGEAHWNTARFPHHILVFVSETGPDRKRKWFYAADRNNEDQYNWSIGQGEEVNRFYLVRRSLYYGRSAAEAAAADPVVAGEFTHPVVATADSRFSKYGFADDTVIKAPAELESMYIVVQRRYIEPVTVDYVHEDSLEKTISITKQIIPAGSQQPPTSTAGTQVEIQNGNVFHDVKITRQIVLGGSTYPYALSTLPTTYNRPFPAKLESVELVWAWARAFQITEPIAPESYSEDYYFKFKITEARPGPYDAIALRFVTNNPNALKATYPIDIIPQPVTESIAVVGYWWYASPEGNRTSATAKEWSVPSTIHETITVTLGGRLLPPSTSTRTESLAATPGVTAFLLLNEMIVDYDVKALPLGLFEVSIIKVNISGLYS